MRKSLPIVKLSRGGTAKQRQQAATTAFNDEFWFDNLGLKKSRDAVDRSRKNVEGRNSEKLISAGDLVAERNFGFWAGLFDSQYEQKPWRVLLKPVFPHISRGLRTRGFVSKRLHNIRLLRNRIFHH